MPKIKFKFYFYSVGNFVVDLKKVNVKNMFSQAAEGLHTSVGTSNCYSVECSTYK